MMHFFTHKTELWSLNTVSNVLCIADISYFGRWMNWKFWKTWCSQTASFSLHCQRFRSINSFFQDICTGPNRYLLPFMLYIFYIYISHTKTIKIHVFIHFIYIKRRYFVAERNIQNTKSPFSMSHDKHFSLCVRNL